LKVLIDEGEPYVTEWKGDWTTATAYVKGDTVISAADDIYVCAIAHTAGTFSTDLAAGKWQIVYDASAIAGIPDGGTTDQVLAKQSAANQDVDWNTIVSGFDKGYIVGMKLSNDTVDADHDIDINEGECRDAADAVDMVLSAITKRIDAAWAVGTNQGGLDTGIVSTDVVYSVWAIYRDDTEVTDVLFSLSHTAPTMPSNYTHKRWIGWVLTDGSSNILPFSMNGEGTNLRYDYDARLLIASSLSQTSYTAQALEVHIPTESGFITEVLFGAISAAALTLHLSDDGTNAKTIFDAVGTSP